MGCDIHPVIEVREFGGWYPRAVPDDGRFYEFFGFLAGVRDSGATALAPRRGLPEGVGSKTRMLLSGDHSESWCTLAEFRSHRAVVESEGEVWEGRNSALDRWDSWIRAAEACVSWVSGATEDDVRFVFNFDS